MIETSKNSYARTSFWENLVIGHLHKLDLSMQSLALLVGANEILSHRIALEAFVPQSRIVYITQPRPLASCHLCNHYLHICNLQQP